MGIPQWQRAGFMVSEFEKAMKSGNDISSAAESVRSGTVERFRWCHDCLLLAVYGLYKNGYIANTIPKKAAVVDYSGFSGRKSLNVEHTFQAIALLEGRDQFFCEVHIGGRYRVQAALNGRYPFTYIAEGSF